MFIRTTKEWTEHYKMCIPDYTPIRLGDELFDQTGESLVGEMALWECGRCKSTAFLLVRCLPALCIDGVCEGVAHVQQTSGPVMEEISQISIGAVFTPHLTHEEHVGRHSGCRVLF